MSYVFSLSGKCSVNLPPASGPLSGQAAVSMQIIEELALEDYEYLGMTLEADDPEAVSLGDLSSANVLMVRVKTKDAGNVLALITHADGTEQVVPVAPMFLLIANASPVTALSLQRAPGVACSASVLLAKAAD